MSESHDDAQRERARQSWELVVELSPRDALELVGSDSERAAHFRRLLRILRVKRSERADLLARLPGVVRRGARVDLLPLETALREAGIVCGLRRRSD